MSNSIKTKLVIYGLAVFVCLVFLLLTPLIVLSVNISNLLTVSTLLFAIYSGFYIAAALSNYLKVQSLVAEETSSLISLYDICTSQEPLIARDLANAIDGYLIAGFDFEMSEAVENTHNEFDAIIKITDKIKNKTTNIFCLILSTRNNLYNTRQEFELSSRRIISKFEWSILIILAGFNIFLIYTTRDGSIISSLLTVIFSALMLLILVTVYLLDTNRLSEEKLSFLIYQTAFKHVGKLPYYPEVSIKKQRVTPREKVYRIGKYTDYPKSVEKEIIIVRT